MPVTQGDKDSTFTLCLDIPFYAGLISDRTVPILDEELRDCPFPPLQVRPAGNPHLYCGYSSHGQTAPLLRQRICSEQGLF